MHPNLKGSYPRKELPMKRWTLVTAASLIAVAGASQAWAFEEARFQAVKNGRGDCPWCDLSGANLATFNLAGVDLSGADLTGADFTGAVLVGTKLEGANCDWATKLPEGSGLSCVGVAIEYK